MIYAAVYVSSYRRASKMVRFSHGGRRKRSDIVPVTGYDGYYLHRLRDESGQMITKEIKPKRSDPDRSPFVVEYEIRRWGKSGRWCKPLTLAPKRNKYNRWDLRVTLGQHRSAYFHRVAGLSLCPCTTDEEGREVEPFWVDASWAPWYEVHHWHT